jgi:hypothetical protein
VGALALLDVVVLCILADEGVTKDTMTPIQHLHTETKVLPSMKIWIFFVNNI